MAIRQWADCVVLATVDELKGLIRLPVGGYGSPRCIRKATDPNRQVQSTNSILIGDDLESGVPESRNYDGCFKDLSVLFESANPVNLESRLPLEQPDQTYVCCRCSREVARPPLFTICLSSFIEWGKPFLVIESAKTEYPYLKNTF